MWIRQLVHVLSRLLSVDLASFWVFWGLHHCLPAAVSVALAQAMAQVQVQQVEVQGWMDLAPQAVWAWLWLQQRAAQQGQVGWVGVTVCRHVQGQSQSSRTVRRASVASPWVLKAYPQSANQIVLKSVHLIPVAGVLFCVRLNTLGFLGVPCAA